VGGQEYTLTDVGTLGGNNSHGTGINISGQVVGYTTLPAGQTGQAFLYSPSTGMQSLGTLGGTYSQAWGINSNGEVRGIAAMPGVAWAAFTYSNGAMTNIRTFASGLGINASGQVTGYWALNGNGYNYAFFYSSSTGFVDLGRSAGVRVSDMRSTTVGR
jgi:probable HAF family extracellular repeat protein